MPRPTVLSKSYSGRQPTAPLSRPATSPTRLPTTSQHSGACCTSSGCSPLSPCSSPRWGSSPWRPTTSSRNARRSLCDGSSELRAARCSRGWYATSWRLWARPSSSPCRLPSGGSGAGWRSTACASPSRRGSSLPQDSLQPSWRCFPSDGRAVARPMPTPSNRSKTDLKICTR